MTDHRRLHLTTAIAYANSKPCLHTLYEVVGADVIGEDTARQMADSSLISAFERLLPA